MAFDLPPFLLIEHAVFIQNRIRNTDLPDIVQQPGCADYIDPFRGQFHRLCHRNSILADFSGMTVSIVVFGVNCCSQRKIMLMAILCVSDTERSKLPCFL